MEFCSDCGSVMSPKKASRSGLLQLVCLKCHKTKKQSHLLPEMVKIIHHHPKQFVTVVGDEAKLNTLPTINVSCPRCGNDKAFVWMVQTKGSDESSTQFMRCTKCRYTFRENS